MGAWIEVHYCWQGQMGNAWGSGMARMYQHELADWIRERTENGHPVLITDVKLIRGEWWVAKVED